MCESFFYGGEDWGEMKLDQKLYGAALFLNPNKFFDIRETNKRKASRLRSMFNDVLWKMVIDHDLQDTISSEADDYERSEGDCFSKPMAIRDRGKKSPSEFLQCFCFFTLCSFFCAYLSCSTC